jgi:hypothetical protein
MNIAQILTFLSQIVGDLSSTSSIGAAITLLEQIVAAAVNEVETITPEIKAIIAQLQSNGAVTAQQMSDLAALDAQVDAAFEAAATAAGLPATPTTGS